MSWHLFFTVLVIATIEYQTLATAFSVGGSTGSRVKGQVGVNIDLLNPGGKPSISTLKNKLHAQWVRIELKSKNYTVYDEYIQELTHAKINTLLIVDYATVPENIPWGKTSVSDWKTYTETFCNKMVEVAQHFGGSENSRLLFSSVKAIEIWNEPDLKQTYVPPSAYGLLLEQCHDQLLVANLVNEFQWIVGGLASGNPNYLVSAVSPTRNHTLFANAVALHPYGKGQAGIGQVLPGGLVQ